MLKVRHLLTIYTYKAHYVLFRKQLVASLLFKLSDYVRFPSKTFLFLANNSMLCIMGHSLGLNKGFESFFLFIYLFILKEKNEDWRYRFIVESV